MTDYDTWLTTDYRAETKCPADNLLLVEQMRKEFARQVSGVLGYEADVEINVYSCQDKDTHSIAHDACLIEHQIWHRGGCLGVRVEKACKINIYVNPLKAVRR